MLGSSQACQGQPDTVKVGMIPPEANKTTVMCGGKEPRNPKQLHFLYMVSKKIQNHGLLLLFVWGGVPWVRRFCGNTMLMDEDPPNIKAITQVAQVG